jgi:UDP-3-O-[3-hydroxymyristoyl] glucosamine N-acyltransferase
MPSFTAARLAELIGGTALGEVDRPLDGLAALEERAGDRISPLLRRNMAHLLESPVPGAVLAWPELAAFALARGVPAAIAHPEPLLALARLIDLFHPETPSEGSIHPSAVVDPGARLHPTARVCAKAVIEAGAEVGEGSWIGPGAVICGCARVGRFVRIGPNAVIGHEGFGFVPGPELPVRIRHVGGVLIEDFVDVGACACVDRGTLGVTVIRAGAKVDNLVQVGHNAEVGRGALIAAQTGLAGSTRVGDGAMLGGQVGVADHRRIGAKARVAGKSGVVSDVGDGETVAGMPTMPHRRWLRAMAALGKKTEDP